MSQSPTDLAKELLRLREYPARYHEYAVDNAEEIAQALLNAEAEIENVRFAKKTWREQSEHNRERIIELESKLETLQAETRRDFLDLGYKEDRKIQDLETKLKLCVEALEFYGQARHFYEKDSEVVYFTIEDSVEMEDHLPGKRARETLSRVKGK